MSSKGANQQFKSPFQSGHAPRISASSDTGRMKVRLQNLQAEIDSLKKEGLKEEELKTHIDKLHEYNEIKDVAQMVLGRIATLEGVRTKDLYAKYGLNLDD